MWLGRGDQSGLMGTLWSNDYRYLIISLRISSGYDPDDKQVLQLTGLVNGRLISSEQELKESETGDFLISVKPGPNDFLLTIVDDSHASEAERDSLNRQLVGLHRIVIKPAS